MKIQKSVKCSSGILRIPRSMQKNIPPLANRQIYIEKNDKEIIIKLAGCSYCGKDLTEQQLTAKDYICTDCKRLHSQKSDA